MSKSETIVVLPDVHVPFHSEPILFKVLKAISTISITAIVLNGDFLDLFSLSKYVENSLYALKEINLTYEYAMGNKVLDLIDRAVDKSTKRYYLYGNHEDRYNRIIAKEDNAKYGTELRSPYEALRLEERKYEFYTDCINDSVRFGNNTEVIHGLYCTTVPAKKHYDMFPNTNIVMGHSHRINSYSNQYHSSHNIGCLADMSSKGFSYRSRIDKLLWQNGFAIITIDAYGNGHINTIPIVNNSFVLNGKIY